MASQTRTPRQQQGDGLVPMMVRVSSQVRDDLAVVAAHEEVSVAEVVRRALEDWLHEQPAC